MCQTLLLREFFYNILAYIGHLMLKIILKSKLYLVHGENKHITRNALLVNYNFFFGSEPHFIQMLLDSRNLYNNKHMLFYWQTLNQKASVQSTHNKKDSLKFSMYVVHCLWKWINFNHFFNYKYLRNNYKIVVVMI